LACELDRISTIKEKKEDVLTSRDTVFERMPHYSREMNTCIGSHWVAILLELPHRVAALQ
jgi:hypothetical protein